MLTRLLPDQVATYWDVIKYGLIESLPPIVGEDPEAINNILTAILSERMQCWIAYDRKKQQVTVDAVAVTEILLDGASGTKNLLVYSLYVYTQLKTNLWLDGTRTLLKYAKSRGCHSVVAYTPNESIVSNIKSLGGEVSYFISLNVDRSINNLLN